MRFVWIPRPGVEEEIDPAPWVRERVEAVSKGIIPLRYVATVRIRPSEWGNLLSVYDKSDNRAAGVMIYHRSLT